MMRLAVLLLLLPALALCQTNLQFQEGATDAVPPGWFVVDARTPPGFVASRQIEGCHGNGACAVLAASANSAADSFGSMMQSFGAEPFRGKTVMLRAWVRVEKRASGDHAQMLLHVGRPNLQPGFVDNMANRPITTGEWGQYEIRGDVAQDAETIQIGLMMYGSGRAWIDGVEFRPLMADTTGPSIATVREAIEKQYARMDGAFTHGNMEEISAILMPGAQMGLGTIREPLLPAIREEIARGAKVTAKTVIADLRLDGDEAIVMVRRDSQVPAHNGARTVVTSHRDTWIQTASGWRWRESIEVSFHWVLPPTSGDAARTVAAELKKRVTPVNDTGDLDAFAAAVGDAHIVALGEAAHGTREFRQAKERMVEYLAAKRGFTLLVAAKDTDVQGLAERLHIQLVTVDSVSAEDLAPIVNGHTQEKLVVWTDNTHLRDARLRAKFGRKLYILGFAFDRGDVRAVGVENGESRGLNVYAASASPEGSGDAVLSAVGIPQFFLNIEKAPFGGALGKWLAETHLFHDLGAYWVLDDPEASLQPAELSPSYDGLYYVEEVHAV
jgi:Erythromycin esterase